MLADPQRKSTAVICSNDLLAIGALLEARAMGLEVPRDLSITGFDDITLAAEFDPPLTTMKVDNAEIGRLAATHLLTCLGGGVTHQVSSSSPYSSNVRQRLHPLLDYHF